MALYFRLMAASVRARLQYKLDFILTNLLYGLVTAGDFLTAAMVLLKYKSVAGWNLYDVAILSGVASCSFGLFRVCASELDNFEPYLVTGEFDNLLIRPWPTLATLLARNFDISRVGAVAEGYLVVALGLRGAVGAGAPLWLVPYVLLLPVTGAVIVAAIVMATASAGFWLIRINELQTFTMNAPMTAAAFPADIFPRWLRYLFTSLLPVMAIGYVPLRYGLGKGGTALALLVPFLAAPLAFFIGLRLWRLGEMHYQSTGN